MMNSQIKPNTVAQSIQAIKTEVVDTCRACLHETTQLKSMDENNLRFTYKEFTTIEVPDSKNPENTPKLCNECVDVLNFFTNFKQKCLRSHDYFLQLNIAQHLPPIEYEDLNIVPVVATVDEQLLGVKIKEEQAGDTQQARNRLKIETVILDELIEIAPVDAPDKIDNRSGDEGEEGNCGRKEKKSKRDPDGKVKKDKRAGRRDRKRKDEDIDISDLELKTENEDEDLDAMNSDENFEDGAESPSGENASENEMNQQFPKKKKKRKMIIDENGDKVYSAQWLAVLEWREKKEKSSIIDENGQKKFTCDLCPRLYDTMHMLRRHETRHKFYKGVVCDLCGLYVCSPAALRKHKSFKHSNNRPYKCDKCDGAFKSKWGLHEHIRTLHSEERNHPCPTCGRMFKSNSRLHAHRKMVHEAERRYHCLICDKKFKKSYVLKRHQLKHSGDKAFSCEICDKPFSTKHACTAHQKIHNSEKNKYLCKICCNLFTNKRHARKHIREFHPGESVVTQVAVLEQVDPPSQDQPQQQSVATTTTTIVAPVTTPIHQVIEIASINQIQQIQQLQHLGAIPEVMPHIQQMPPSC